MTTRNRIRRVGFVPPLPLGIEVVTFARLREMAPPGALSRPVRPDFHSLLLVVDGEARHEVDFVEHRLEQGSALWVRPGQVQLFGDEDPTGDLVLFQAEFLIPGTRAAAIADERTGPVTVARAAEARPAIDRARRALRRSYTDVARAGVVDAPQMETLRHLLSVLVLSLDGAQGPPRDPSGLHHRFVDLLERDFARAHDVEHYARTLGYSMRTLARAAAAATGRSPKQAISDRIALEARRLLAHTDRPVGSVARELGFRDASNFAAFFARRTGESPTAFRRRRA